MRLRVASHVVPAVSPALRGEREDGVWNDVLSGLVGGV